MGWRMSVVLVDGEADVALEDVLARVVGEPVIKVGTTTVDEALFPFHLVAGTYQGRTLIFDKKIPWALLHGAPGREHRLLEVFPNHRLLVAYLNSTTNHYGYAYYENGSRLRLRTGTFHSSGEDEGELLPAEQTFYRNTIERNGETLIVQNQGGEKQEFTHDQLGEEFVFALTGVILGEPLIIMDELLYETDFWAYARASETEVPTPIAGNDLTLEVENEGIVVSPKFEDVMQSLAWLSPSGPSYLILEREERDYLQAGGSAQGMTVEYRYYEGDSFRHFVVGRSGEDSTSEAEIPMSGGCVTVQGNEVLDLETAQGVFAVFFRGEPRSKKLSWRDVTERFV